MPKTTKIKKKTLKSKPKIAKKSKEIKNLICHNKFIIIDLQKINGGCSSVG